MIEETKHSEHSDVGFEHQDLSARAVFTFLIGLALAGVLVYFVIWGIYSSMDAYERRHEPPQSPLVKPEETDTRIVSPAEVMKFPQPRLERNERLEINDFRLKEEQTLNSYGWVDEKAGVVHIPIERAMELVAKRGLPTTPRVGTAPPSPVNVVNQAAARSDTSNLSSQGENKEKKK